jgi:hypothetical protein
MQDINEIRSQQFHGRRDSGIAAKLKRGKISFVFYTF